MNYSDPRRIQILHVDESEDIVMAQQFFIDSMIKALEEEMEKVMKVKDALAQRADVDREDLDTVVTNVKTTAGIIADIRNRMGQISERARKGMESTGKVSKGVGEVASSAEVSASSAEEVSSTVEAQTAAIEQLSVCIEKISETSEQTTQMIAEYKLRDEE